MERLTEAEIAWVAGLLEGEGSFLRASPSQPGHPRVTVQMTDEDVIRRIREVVGHGCVVPTSDTRNPDWQPAFRWTVKGTPAVELMEKVRPWMYSRRREQLDAALASYSVSRRSRLTDAQVRRIRGLLGSGMTDREVSRETGHAHSCVGRIRRGVSYANVT